MHVEQVLQIVTDIFDSSFPGAADGEIPPEIIPFLSLDRFEAIQVILRNRTFLDETIPGLLAMKDSHRSVCILELPGEVRFSLLDRLAFAHGFLGDINVYEKLHRTFHSYRMPSFLIDLLTGKYKTDVLFPCLSSRSYPYLWKTFVKIDS